MSSSQIFPLVNYDENSFFTMFSDAAAEALDNQLRPAVDEIDQAFEESMSCWERRGHSAVPTFDKDVRPAIERVARILQDSTLEAQIKMWALAALAGATRQLALQFRLRLFQRDFRLRSIELSDSLNRLKDQGFVVFEIPADIKSQIDAAIAGPKTEIAQQALEDPERRLSKRMPEFGQAGQCIRRWMKDRGVISVAEAYIRHKLEFEHLHLQYSHPEQAWFKYPYGPEQVAPSRLAYLHTDYDPVGIKAVIYLGAVSGEEGPFRFVRGSHLWARSWFQQAFFKELDKSCTRMLKIKGSGPNFRSIFTTSSGRETFMKLPSCLRGTSHFGDDLHSESDEYLRITGQEESLISESPLCILFDGWAGLHRGSLVESGERWAFQIGFRAHPGEGSTARLRRGLRSSRNWLRTKFK